MVSKQKRMEYVSDNEENSSDAESFEDSDSTTQTQNNLFSNGNSERMPTRKPKCFSRNALMARENRLKKKLYVNSLEKEVSSLKNDNKKLSSVMENQSFMISELRKEIKYLKSVIANSSDISKLIKNIHQSTGMSVSTSLDKTLSLNNCVSKRTVPIARKTAHPWDENKLSHCSAYPSPPSETDSLFDSFNNDDILMMNVSPIETIPTNIFEEDDAFNPSLSLSEHNYTSKLLDNDERNDDDIGVCLHVSKHKVSLEFCQSCNENATQGWTN